MSTDNKTVSDKVKVSAPDGFDINAGRELADGWAKKEEGNIIQGRLIGRFSMGDEGRFYYQVKLDKPCKAISGRGDETEEVNLSAGQLANVDESKAMEDIKQYATNGGVYDIWICYGAKQKSDKGTFWPIVNGPRVKMIKAPPKVPF